MFTKVLGKMEGIGPISEADINFSKYANENEARAIAASQRAVNKTHEQVAKELGLPTAQTEIKAKYKIEVYFGPDRTIQGPNLCLIHIWESGRRLHGGGDDMMFWCLDATPGSTNGCGAPIVSDFIKGNIAICPNCKRAVNSSLLVTQKAGKVSTKFLAKDLAKLFHTLGSNADIYCKYDRRDIRVKVQEREVGIERAIKLKGLHIYPLKNILKDTSNGADLEKRIYAFLTA